MPGDPGQVVGAGEAKFCDGKGLLSTLLRAPPPLIPAGFGDGVGNMPAGLGACKGLANGELATPNALPGPAGDGCGSIDGEGFTPPAGGNDGGDANENEDVAGLDPNPCACCCCC